MTQIKLDADLVLAIETLMESGDLTCCKIKKQPHCFWVCFYVGDILAILVEVTKKQTYLVCKIRPALDLAKKVAIDTGWQLTDWDDIVVEV